MTDSDKLKIRDVKRAETLSIQRNNAQNEVVEAYAHIAVLEAELAEARAEIESLKLPKPKGK